MADDPRGPGEPAGEWYEVESRYPAGDWTGGGMRFATAEQASGTARAFRDHYGRPARVVRVRGEVVEEFGGGEGGGG